MIPRRDRRAYDRAGQTMKHHESSNRSGRTRAGSVFLGLALAATLGALHCNLLVKFSDCTADRECNPGERCNAVGHYCEVPVVETCNGLDDDHDGVPDTSEDFGPCDPDETPRPGMCRDGRRRCLNGSALMCVRRATSASSEVCHNGLDDDCNSTVDDQASCMQNYPATMNFPIGSDDPAYGEGDDAPLHRVCISNFSIDRHEVTFEAFLVWLNALHFRYPSRVRIGAPPAPLNRSFTYGQYVLYQDDPRTPNAWSPLVRIPAADDPRANLAIRFNGSLFEPVSPVSKDLPMVNVTWIAADRYCRWAGKHLPTEAEFFRAMRGATGDRTYPWGNEPPTCDRANVSPGTDGGTSACANGPVPVGSLPNGRNMEGVSELYGNVDEWMWDYLDTTPNHDRNNYYFSLMPTEWCMRFPNGPLGPAVGSPIAEPSGNGRRCENCRFSRGRRFESTDLRPNIRKWMDADRAEPGIGFRCATGGADR
jgi:formylglycine-generating enzyme required for sulfatase activity